MNSVTHLDWLWQGMFTQENKKLITNKRKIFSMMKFLRKTPAEFEKRSNLEGALQIISDLLTKVCIKRRQNNVNCDS